MSGFIGGILDAWAELRTHKLRVLLSLIGITIAVTALTGIAAVGAYAEQYQAESGDRNTGRVASLAIEVTSTTAVDNAAIDDRMRQLSDRFTLAGSTRYVRNLFTDFPTPEGFRKSPLELVDPDHQAMFRVPLVAGRNLRASDGELLAPAVQISEFLWGQLGQPSIELHPTIELGGELAGTYQIVGVLKDPPGYGGYPNPMVRMLVDSYLQKAGGLPADAAVERYVWVGEDEVNEIAPILASDLRAGLAADQTLTVRRVDWKAWGVTQGILLGQLVAGAAAGLVLVLAALGLLNVQLVAMRQRIREIGVRRAFGATRWRLFMTVVLESVVATTVAGILGVAIAVAALRLGLMNLMMPGLEDTPPVPYTAAFIGLGAAVVIGALAGLVPAIVAGRVKVIDAIRF